MKPRITLFLPILLICCLVYSTSLSGQLYLKVPVRVIVKNDDNTGYQYVTHLNKEDFTLRINGQSRPIVDFSRKKRAIDDTSPGRQFVLSFDASGYGKPLVDAVSYFVHHILTPSDQLLVRSPFHTYQINPQFSKEDMVKYIKTNLERDTLQWQENKKLALNNLSQLIVNLGKKLDAKKGGIRSVLFFINHYTYQWRKFDKEFLLSSLVQYSEMASLLAQGGGEKWLIHFQERDLIPMLARYQRIAAKLKKFVSKLPKGYEESAALIRTSLDKIEKSMLFAEDFPMEELLNVLLGVNISYNVVFFSGQSQENQAEAPVSVSPGYEEILKDISRRTGGIFLMAKPTNPDLVQNLETISKHVDIYYELAFDAGAEPEDKNLEIGVTPANARAYYKTGFKKDELKWLLDWVKQEISLADVTLAGHQLSFTIADFTMKPTANDQEASGLVKVDIRLINDKNAVIYQTDNTLKPLERSIKISLSIPSQFKGYFKLSITAYDLVTQKSSQVNKYVKIN